MTGTIKQTAASLVVFAGMASAAYAADPEICGTGEPATGEPIIVGAIVGQTGPADFSSAAKSTAAVFACVNANGGINGRPIEYLVEDDAWNPENASNAAAKLVNDNNAVVLTGSTSFVECGTNASFYQEAGIASVAGVGVPRECFFSKNIAPVNMGRDCRFWGQR